jgi:hypothetical protein
MELLPFPAVAEALGVPVTRIHQFVRDGHLVAVSNDDGKKSIPALFVQEGVADGAAAPP